MKQLILNHKTGFKNLTPTRPVIIRDFRSKMFYSTIGLKPVEQFNLPAGNYYIEQGNIQALKKPVTFPFYPMPKTQRNFPPPFDYSITFNHNPNRCTIHWGKKIIVFDKHLKNLTLPELFFILYHEFGHHLYRTERFADLYARNMMIKKGYNPSQIGKSPITSLSSKQYPRKKFIVNTFLKHNHFYPFRLPSF